MTIIVRDTAENLNALNPFLEVGESGLETDTGLIKDGDGVTGWRALPYHVDEIASPPASQADIEEAIANTIEDQIANGDLDAPTQNAVFDALALKQPLDTQLTSLAALTYTGNALEVVRVNAGETGFELATVSGGATDINGLSDAISDNVTNFTVFLGQDSGNLTQTGTSNTAVGIFSLNSNTSGSDNNAHGQGALRNNTSGNQNTAMGHVAGFSNTTGISNTAIGYTAFRDGTGDNNTAVGAGALFDGATGDKNTAIGAGTLQNNTASENTALGFTALIDNTSGSENTAVGFEALKSNTTNVDNVAIGWQAMSLANGGDENVAIGYQALQNVTGDDNTGIGSASLGQVTSGATNTAVGAYSGGTVSTGADNALLGSNAGITITTGSSNTCIGADADVSGVAAAGQIVIGAGAVGLGDNQAVIGTATLTDVTLGDGTAVIHADGSALTGVAFAETNGTLGGIASGVTVEEVSSGTLHKTIITFTNVAMPLADETGVGAYSSAKIYTLPKGVLGFNILDNLVITKSSAGVSDTWSGLVGVGRLAAVDYGLTNAADYANGGQTLGPATAGVQNDKQSVRDPSLAQTLYNINNTTTSTNASTMYYNLSVQAADETVAITPCDFIVNGTMTITWTNLGDF